MDDSHVDADTPYAEVEVMKMCMPLLSPASEIIQFKISEGQEMQVYSVLCREYKCLSRTIYPKSLGYWVMIHE